MEEIEKQRILSSFGIALRKRRHALGWSQEELAHRAGITMRYVSLLETGKRVPTIVVFVALAKAMEVSGQSFMSEVEENL